MCGSVCSEVPICDRIYVSVCSEVPTCDWIYVCMCVSVCSEVYTSRSEHMKGVNMTFFIFYLFGQCKFHYSCMYDVLCILVKISLPRDYG